MNRPLVIFVASHPMSINCFLMPHIRALSSIARVIVFTNQGSPHSTFKLPSDISVISVPILRKISPLNDLFSLFILFSYFILLRPSAVHTITPKAGLLGITASFLANVPLRVHFYTGQVWATKRGLSHLILKSFDRITSRMSTCCLVDSPSQRRFLIDQFIIHPKRSLVLASGSVCGINTVRFRPSASARNIARREMGASADSFVFLFLGRLTQDKGILDLARAFILLAQLNSKAELWIVGPDESDISSEIFKIISPSVSKVKRRDFTTTPELFMQGADLFCLPSYREGFGSSVIEAAACGLPSLVSRIYGLTDAVLHGQTGLFHEPGNVDELFSNMRVLMSSPETLHSMGRAAQQYAVHNFSESILTNAMLSFYIPRLVSLKC